MPESSSSSGPGQRVNDYLILEKLGAGGMGVVYKAHDEKLDRTVALKFLPPDIQADEAAKDRFLREARAASKLDHPNVGVIYGIEETDGGRLFIVMAYYDGETIAAKIRGGPLPLTRVLDYARQMARGLAETHSLNVIHRDIKPSNTIVNRQGVVKIVDFGLARVISSASATQSAAVAGTAAYMSPEQALGKMLDHRTDIWSLGSVLYQMITGRLAFEGDSTPAMLYAIVNAPPAAMDGSVPAEVQQIIYRALVKNPSGRYQSCADMLRDLDEVSAALPDARSHTITIGDLAKSRERASQSAMSPALAPNRMGRRISILVLASLAALAILMGAAFAIPALRESLLGYLLAPAQKHIAVLPFTSVGNVPLDGAVVGGLMESLTSELSNLEGGHQSLWVVPASEVRRRNISDPVGASKELGATLVVTGSVQRDSLNVRLTVNLIDAKNMRQLGSGSFEDHSGDFWALQDAAVKKLAGLMNLSVRGAPGSVGNSPAAYEAYLKALGFLQRYDKPGNLDSAIGTLNEAVKTDPKFTLALASLGRAYYLKYRLDQNPRWIEAATVNCKRALDLNDQLAPVHMTLGSIQKEAGHLDLALQEFQRALELDPRSVEALAGVAGVSELQGRAKDAEDTYRRAIALRPDYWDGYNSLGDFYNRQHRYAEAASSFRKVIQLTPDNSQAYYNLSSALIALKKLDEAAAALKKAISLSPSYAAYTNLAVVYYSQNDYASAAQWYEKALKLNSADYRVWMGLAMTERWLSDDTKAMDAYSHALPLLEALAKNKTTDATVQSRLGLLYARVQRREQALERLQTSLALDPKDNSVMERAGEAYEALGDRPKALEWLTKALSHGYSMDSLKHNPEVRSILSDPNFKPPPSSK